ncbi:hypothetical protein [Trujillonella endophytica]|uniref:Uncharacterized protein n=1 Tax=Trujillonella endophytica TaxID=673521 RepID=A0A1H8WMC1_9ACTN|nr:hypothetical protein [Trujillella endophytica]SEP28238.1 hypothetical protein SAMN05660991_04502 [Trujillella endophytica]
MSQQQELSPRAQRRLEKRLREALPPYDGPEAASPPLRWVRRFTPLGIGRRRVVVRIGGGRLQIVRTPRFGGERVVAEGALAEFHGAAPSRGGRGLHLWHGDRLFRLTGRSTARHEGGGSDSWTLGDDPVSAVIAVVLLPFLLVYLLWLLIGSYTAMVRSERENAATTLRWLRPVLGAPLPGRAYRPPLPGRWPALGRWLVRLAVLGAIAAGAVLAIR